MRADGPLVLADRLAATYPGEVVPAISGLTFAVGELVKGNATFKVRTS